MATLEKLENGKVKITIEVPAAKLRRLIIPTARSSTSPASARDMLRAR